MADDLCTYLRDPLFDPRCGQAADKIECLAAALTEARAVLEMLDRPDGEGDCLSVRRQGKPIGSIIDDALNGKRT